VKDKLMVALVFLLMAFGLAASVIGFLGYAFGW
jgi:hypothetical protein